MSNELPSVSVVVATRNRPELMRITLRGVFAQDYPGPVNLILVYDQSEPDFGLMEEFAGESLSIISNTRTPGLAGARNSGIEAATGEWVAFCDDDDDWMPGKLSAQIALLQTYPDAVVLATGVLIDYDGKQVPRLPGRKTIPMRALLESRVMEAHPSSIMVRRSTLINEIGLVDEEIPGSYGEDYEWILRAARVGEIAVADEPLVRIRWHTGSFFAERWRTIIDGIDYLLAKVPDFESVPKGHARLLGRQAFALAAMGERKAAFAKAWKTFRVDWRERRSYVAAAVASGLVSADWLIAWAHRHGRAI